MSSVQIEGVIFDWAGTTVDFGCFAPVNVFVDVFAGAGIDVTMAEAREPMGMLKIDHIRAMLSMPRISALWAEKYGRSFTEQDVHDLFAVFEPALMKSLADYTDPIPHVLAAIATLREQGLKIGSTTGYTDAMMEVVAAAAAAKGYTPDCYVTADLTSNHGRPYPYMVFRNMERLGLSSARQVVKVGDTLSDIREGVNAGVWTLGVVVGSSEMGLTEAEYAALSCEERDLRIAAVTEKFYACGAHFVITTMEELPGVVRDINKLLAAGTVPGGEINVRV
jgi:phosphonoacetaldehyde hydrolase